MSKKRFYNNKRRGKKWTEQPVGRKIYFADKYIPEGDGDSKFNKQRHTKKPLFTKERLEGMLKGIIATVCSAAIIFVGYTIMDIHLERNAMPYDSTQVDDAANLNNIKITIRGTDCQPLSLDAGIMLGAVIDTAYDNGYISVAFDLKRNDGTIGYTSRLASISAYGAISSPSGNLGESVKLLKDSDLLPVGRISCYKDSIAANADLSSAVFKDGTLYKDSAGNAYLNPDAEGSYSYIRSIVDEAMELGITVFVLDNYNLPSDISKSYNDGFDAISSRLYSDFGDELKLYRAVNINITSGNVKSINEQWKEKTHGIDINDSSVMLCITARDKAMVKQYLDNRGITNYIISE